MDAEVARTARTRDIELKLLLDAIYLRYHYDFRSYAAASLRRRMTAALPRFGCETVSQLQERLLHDPTTFPQLLDYLTVQVSEMFRDPAYFLALRERVVPLLRTYPSLKVWVAGCSTGEEAYSLAILLREEGLASRTQIYATDINPHALRRAEAGIYELDRIALFTTLALPVVLVLLIGLSFGQSADRLPVGMVLSDPGPLGTSLVAELEESPAIDVQQYDDRNDLYRDIRAYGRAATWTLSVGPLVPGQTYTVSLGRKTAFRPVSVVDVAGRRTFNFRAGGQFTFTARTVRHAFEIRAGAVR